MTVLVNDPECLHNCLIGHQERCNRNQVHDWPHRAPRLFEEF